MLAQVVKTLVLIRHAQAAGAEDVPDHERPLTERGRRDARQAGTWLRSQGLAPEIAVVSSATRAQETYRGLAGELATPPEQHRGAEDAYYAAAGELLDILRTVPPQRSNAMLIAHNPGIGMLAAALDDGESTAEGAATMRAGFSTASVAVFELPGQWAELDPGVARLTAYTVARG